MIQENLDYLAKHRFLLKSEDNSGNLIDFSKFWDSFRKLNKQQ